MSESNTSIEILESFERELSSRGHMVQCIGSPWWQMTFNAKDILDGILTLKTERDELLQKVQQLEAENAELRELRRWRDARKETPPKIEGQLCSKEVQIMSYGGRKTIYTGYYDYSGNTWLRFTGFDCYPVHVNYWRPLDLPEEVK